MSETNLAPGPWAIGDFGTTVYYVHSASGYVIAEVPRDRNYKDSAPYHARLIAAAPEMLREMERLLPVLERAEADESLWARFTDGLGIATLNSYRTAIAKAKGE